MLKTPSRTRRSRRPRWVALLLLSALALSALTPALWLRVRAARLLLATLDAKGASAGALALATDAVRTHAETIVLPDGVRLRSRSYLAPGQDDAPPLLLLHGVHPLGIDEARLTRFARALAASGLHVHTPELPQLLSLEIDPRVVQQIAACATALRAQHGGRKLGAFGISFAGGLLLMAAATPQGEQSFAYVVAVGAHADLRRVLRRYAGERAVGPNGERADSPVEAYGARVLLTAYAQTLFAAQDVGPAREALRLFLAENYAESRALAKRLTPAGAAQLQVLTNPDGRGLQPLLTTLERTQSASLAALSPAGQLGGLRVPTFLLHGAEDPIVPSTESVWLAHEVPPVALERVLITPALRHAEAIGKPSLAQQLDLVEMIARILARAR